MNRTLPEANERRTTLLVGVACAVVVLLLALGLFHQFRRLEQRMARLTGLVEEAADRAGNAEANARQAVDRASRAEKNARLAANARARAESDALLARSDAHQARAQADRVETELERVRRNAEAELNRLHDALGQVVETRRTALGLVMNLGSEALEFDFDKSFLRPENKELLSRIAGILLTSSDYTVSIYGHTDDVGSDAYNLQLSERRARAVRDYLVSAGIDPDLTETRGFGKTRPLVEGTSEAARARNRRVEIGIVNTTIRYTETARKTEQP